MYSEGSEKFECPQNKKFWRNETIGPIHTGRAHANSNANPLMLLVCSVDTPIHINRSHLLAWRCASHPASCVDWAMPFRRRNTHCTQANGMCCCEWEYSHWTGHQRNFQGNTKIYKGVWRPARWDMSTLAAVTLVTCSYLVGNKTKTSPRTAGRHSPGL